jgi:parallel beta-helix repeat protein
VLNAYLDDSLPRQIALTGNRVSNNLVRNNEASGISAIGLVRSVISENTVLDNGLVLGFPGNGIAVQPLLLAGGDGNVVVMRNQVHGNARNGIEITSRSNAILNNDASHNNKKPTFSQRGWDLRDTDPNCARNTWSGNTWGSGSFSPLCTTAGEHQAPSPVTAAQAAESTATGRARPATPPLPLALTSARPHPPYPG